MDDRKIKRLSEQVISNCVYCYPLILLLLLSFSIRGRTEEDSGTNSDSTPSISFTSSSINRSGGNVYIEVRFRSSLPSKVPVHFYLYNLVQQQLMDRQVQKAGVNKVVFGPYNHLWESSYQVESLVKKPELTARAINVDRYKQRQYYHLKTSQDVPPPFIQRRNFQRRYHQAIDMFYKMYIDTYPQLVPVLYAGNHPGEGRWQETIKSLVTNLRSKLKTIQKILDTMGDPTLSGYPFRQKVKQLRKLFSVGREFFHQLLREVPQTGKDWKLLPEKSTQNPSAGKFRAETFEEQSLEQLRIQYFLPLLNSVFSSFPHPIRMILRESSGSLLTVYTRFVRALLNVMQQKGTKEQTEWETLYSRLQRRQRTVNKRLNRHLWLFRDRGEQLRERDQKLSRKGLFLKRVSGRVRSMKSQLGEVFQNHTSEGEEVLASIRKVLQHFVKLRKIWLYEQWKLFETIYTSFKQRYRVIERYMKKPSIVSTEYIQELPDFYGEWEEKWRETIGEVKHQIRQKLTVSDVISPGQEGKREFGENEEFYTIREQEKKGMETLRTVTDQFLKMVKTFEKLMQSIGDREAGGIHREKSFEKLEARKEKFEQTFHSFSTFVR